MALRWDHAELALMPSGAAPSYTGPGLDNWELANIAVFASDMNVDWTCSTKYLVLVHFTGHLVLRRSTKVNRGQMRSMTFADFFEFTGHCLFR